MELQQLKLALKIISQYEHDAIDYTDPDVSMGEDEATPSAPAPLPVQTPPPSAPTPPPAAPFDPRPICTACDSRMNRARRTMPSGMTVEYWHCSHSGCNNEMY